MGALLKSVLFLLAAFGLAYFTLKNSLEKSALQKHGATISATTTGAYTIRKNGGSGRCNIRYTFNVDHKEYQGSGEVKAEAFKRFSNGRFVLHTHVLVRYLPDNPYVNRIAEEDIIEDSSWAPGLWIIVIIIGALGIAGIHYSLRDLSWFNGSHTPKTKAMPPPLPTNTGPHRQT